MTTLVTSLAVVALAVAAAGELYRLAQRDAEPDPDEEFP